MWDPRLQGSTKEVRYTPCCTLHRDEWNTEPLGSNAGPGDPVYSALRLYNLVPQGMGNPSFNLPPSAWLLKASAAPG